MLPPLPRCSAWAYSSLISPSRVSLPRKGHRVGLHIVLFEACSAFTRVAACTLARSPIRDPLSEGFRHFVSSMPAPVASGWSGCRVGLAPTGKRRLVTAHPHRGRCVELLRHRNKGGASRIEDLDDLGKIGERAGQPVDLVDDHDIDAPCRDVGEQPLQSRPTHRRAGEPAVVITRVQAHPAFVALAGDEGLASLALRLQRIEFLFEPLLGGFAGVDGAANPCVPPCAEAHWSRHRPALAPAKTRAPSVRPKNRGPDQWASVIRSAIAVSDR